MRQIFGAVLLGCALGLTGPAGAVARELTIEEAITQTLQNSAVLREAARQSDIVALGEARYLSIQDPQLSARYDYLKDQTSPVVPFQGNRNITSEWGLGLSQALVTGTQVSLDWLSNDADSNAALRPVNPAVASSLALTLSQSLLRDFWGRPDRAIRGREREATTAAEGDLRRLEDTLSAEASRNYWRLRIGYRLLSIEQEALADARKLLTKQQEKKRYGTALESDVLQADAAKAVYEADLVVIENLIWNQQFALLETMGILDQFPPEDKVNPVSLYTPQWTPPGLKEAVARAWETRPDVQAARARAKAADHALSLAKLQVLPRLDLSAGLGWTGLDTQHQESWDDTFSGDHPVFRTGLSLSVPMSFRRERIDRQAAHYRVAVEQASLDALRQRVEREVRTAWENWRAVRAKYEAYERVAKAQSAKLAEERREVSRGRSSTDQFIRFQEDARTARRRLAGAEEELALSEIGLRYAIGESLRPGAAR